MRAHSDNLTFIQYDNPVCIHYRAYPLCDDKDRRFRGLLLERSTQLGIGLEVQRGEAVIEQIYLRLPDEGTGDRQTLLLAAGDVAAPWEMLESKPSFIAVTKS